MFSKDISGAIHEIKPILTSNAKIIIGNLYIMMVAYPHLTLGNLKIILFFLQ